MSDVQATAAVPRDEALRVCAELQAEHHRNWLKFALWQCWGCVKFSKGDASKMCGEVVACGLVTARYRRTRGQ